MAKTPEGVVKDSVKELLIACGLIPAGKAALATKEHTGKFHMPVSNGMGVAGIPDFYGHYRGFYFEIETKALGKEPTPLQWHQLKATNITGAMYFVIDGEKGLTHFRNWVVLVNARLDGFWK